MPLMWEVTLFEPLLKPFFERHIKSQLEQVEIDGTWLYRSSYGFATLSCLMGALPIREDRVVCVHGAPHKKRESNTCSP